MPYFVMIDRLRGFLRNSEKPVALVVIGYSFADEHINEAIMESLKVNASAACFALQFGELASINGEGACSRQSKSIAARRRRCNYSP